MDIEHTLYTTRGAISAVARDLGISTAAVSMWRRRGIPPGRLEAVEVSLRRHVQSFAPHGGPRADVLMAAQHDGAGT